MYKANCNQLADVGGQVEIYYAYAQCVPCTDELPSRVLVIQAGQHRPNSSDSLNGDTLTQKTTLQSMPPDTNPVPSARQHRPLTAYLCASSSAMQVPVWRRGSPVNGKPRAAYVRAHLYVPYSDLFFGASEELHVIRRPCESADMEVVAL